MYNIRSLFLTFIIYDYISCIYSSSYIIYIVSFMLTALYNSTHKLTKQILRVLKFSAYIKIKSHFCYFSHAQFVTPILLTEIS